VKTPKFFARQISVQKYLMCCEGIVAGLKLPEGDDNKHRNA